MALMDLLLSSCFLDSKREIGETFLKFLLIILIIFFFCPKQLFKQNLNVHDSNLIKREKNIPYLKKKVQ